MDYAVQIKNVTKAFGTKVIANKNVSMEVGKGEILAVLGENGSGKTTLMNMLAGIYYPDQGEILVNGQRVEIRSPKDAYNLGIGMIHQHFKLIDVFTALENIALGLDSSQKFDLEEIGRKTREICDRYHFDLDLRQKVYTMSVSQKQTLEIIKVLYRGADILILDEPTAVLTPQETERLFNVIRNMRDDGKSVIIITHKLHEVLEISDRVVILRKGEYIGSVKTSEATESLLTEKMVGRKVELNIRRTDPVDPEKRLSVKNLTVYSKDGIKILDDISFDAFSGEILGIAGISGNGQKELLEAIAGLQVTAKGSSVEYFEKGKEDHPVQLIGKNTKQIRDIGVHLGFVPEDRLGMGLVGSMGMTGNMMLKTYYNKGFIFTDSKTPGQIARDVKEKLEVVTPNVNTPVRQLSGGNVQKVLVGREIAEMPAVLMTAYAVRGLDINTSYLIYNLLDDEKKNGVAVIYVGEDLDVLIDLCDRILVLCGGKVSGILDARTTSKEEVGLLMTNLRKEGEKDNE